MRILFFHYFKDKIRAFYYGKSWFYIALKCLVYLYCTIFFGFAGYFLDRLLNDIYPNIDIFESFGKFLFYYFIIDFIFRFKFHELNLLHSIPYFSLPIPRKNLYKFPLFANLISIYNGIGMLILTPFIITVVLPSSSIYLSFIWVLWIGCSLLTLSFLSTFFKLYSIKNKFFGYLLFLFIIIFFYAENTGFISYSQAIYWFIKQTEHHYYLLPVMPLIAFGSFKFCLRFLKSQKYSEYVTEEIKNVKQFNFLKRFGSYVYLDVLFLIRNKGIRGILMSFITMPSYYYFMLFTSYDGLNYLDSKILFFGIFSICNFTLMYGNIIFSGHASYFDGLLSKRLSMYEFIRSKYLLLLLSMIINYLLILPIGFLNPKIPLINFSLLFFSMGYIPFLVLIIACYRYSPFHIVNNSSFKSISRFKFINFLPLLITFFPLLLIKAFDLFGVIDISFYVLAFLGFIGVVSSKWWLKSIALKFNENKYKMSSGFRT